MGFWEQALQAVAKDANHIFKVQTRSEQSVRFLVLSHCSRLIVNIVTGVEVIQSRALKRSMKQVLAESRWNDGDMMDGKAFG